MKSMKRWFSALLTVVIVLGAAGLALMPAQARGDRDDPPDEAPVPYSLALVPPMAEGPVPGVHRVVATVRVWDRNPIEGVEVSFVVTGAHRATGRVETDWRGEADWSYRGTVVGEDRITAYVGELTARATMRWLVPVIVTHKVDLIFVNTTNQPVNDIHFDFDRAPRVLDPGPFGDITGNGTSMVTLSNPLNAAGDPAPIPPGGSVVLKFGTDAAASLSYNWWWTMDGRRVGEKRQGTGVPVPTVLEPLVGFQTSVTRKFTNSTGRSVNDIHFQFAQGTTILDRDRGPFRHTDGSGTSTVRLSNPLAPIGPGETVVLRFQTEAGRLRYERWWWTWDGRRVGPEKGTGRAREFPPPTPKP